jgi:hypothetical protein
MTANQITKKLVKGNVSLEGLKINLDEIEICLGYEESNGFGSCDEELIDERRNEIFSILPEFNGGFYTGYGALILRVGYKSKGDWNDPSSEWHY